MPKLSVPKSKLTNSIGHNAALLGVVPTILLLLILSLLKIKDASTVAVDALCIGLGAGITGGAVGITTAHEFIHRKSKFLRGEYYLKPLPGAVGQNTYSTPVNGLDDVQPEIYDSAFIGAVPEDSTLLNSGEVCVDHGEIVEVCKPLTVDGS